MQMNLPGTNSFANNVYRIDRNFVFIINIHKCIMLVKKNKEEEKLSMKGEERRQKLIDLLESSDQPLSGTFLAKKLSVSRQVIVQDIALIRASGRNIFSLSKGYVIEKNGRKSRVFKVIHKPEETREELTMIIDLGGSVQDIFIYHKVYGLIRGDLHIASRHDIDYYIEQIESGKSKMLSPTTSGYHYHTVMADNEEILDLIQEKLTQRGFLAQLQDYEPVDFWKNKKDE